MTTILVPIEGLTVLADRKVGPVAVRPAAEALSDARQGRALGNVEWFDELGAGQGPSAFAAADLDAAIDLVAQAVAIRDDLQLAPR
ncbi:hypothetical protein ACFWDB_06940 [Micromonospora chalcea]|uniref:hypothetical protein n=1 Tax=Micromonospora sp. TSRI0369 TaxID=1703936 RepID=UPI001160FD30|nr:hypothetical protein [Micromonospora sp. TSRI0369]